jgi:hypothetical protein
MTASPRESGLFRRYMSARNPVRKNLQAFQPTKVIARTVRAAADARTEPGEIGCCARTRQKGGRRPLQHEDPRVWMAYTMYGDQRFTVLDICRTFTQEAVITRILRHGKLAAVLPLACPCAPRSVRLGGIRHPRHQAPRAVGSTPRCLRCRAWSRGRCAYNGGVSLEWTTPLSVCHPVCNPSPPRRP